MAPPRRGRRARANAAASRYTIDASVFVNAFNPHERGHAESLQVITTIHERGDPIIVPALLVPEVASALARVTGDSAAALDYARAITSLPHLTVISLTAVAANHAAELAAKHRLRGADAVYLAVARRYGTAVVTRDAEQRARGSSVVACLTPEEALRGLGPSDR
jgi:predicted nucleic acid-binding protein